MKTILTTLIIILFIGCTDYSTDPIDAPPTGKSYLSMTEYNSLIATLENKSNITGTTIKNELDKLGISTATVSSYYTGTIANCHSYDWYLYGQYTGGWIYYVSVNIWVDKNGDLYKSMCSYYKEN